MKLKREIDKELENKRHFLFLVIVGAIFSLLIARLYYLQIIKTNYYKQKSFSNSFREDILKATRGKIYDVNGDLLADNSTGYKLVYKNTPVISSEDKEYLIKMKNVGESVVDDLKENKKKKLKELFSDIIYISKISESDFMDILDIFYRTKPIGSDKEIVVDDDIPLEKALINSEILPNDRLDIVEYNKRKYVENELASHVIGYVKHISNSEYEKLKDDGYNPDDLIGKKGIEKEYDKRIRGIDGFRYVEVNARGDIINKLDEKRAQKGDDIYLSIDNRLQKAMTKYMKNTNSAFIAIDVKTGKIITFVSSPEIDSNLLSSKINLEEWKKIVNSPKTPLLNKGITGLYPPGSTFKLIVSLAILESGISPYEKVMSTGKFEYGNVVFKDSHIYGHGLTDLNKAIEESVNTYYYNLSLRIPRNSIEKVANEFGVGQKLGIDIPGEQDGLLPTPEWKAKKFSDKRSKIWLPGDTINLSIGQGYLLMTPLQVLMLYQTIANDGLQMVPTLVDKFVKSDGEIEENRPKIRTKVNINSKNIKLLQKALTFPVKGENGTAKVLNLPFVDVSAKTGTAQNISKNHHSWIAGYFPSKNPKIAFVSFVQEGGYGGVAAGKQAREFIMQYYKKGEEENGEKN